MNISQNFLLTPSIPYPSNLFFFFAFLIHIHVVNDQISSDPAAQQVFFQPYISKTFQLLSKMTEFPEGLNDQYKSSVGIVLFIIPKL